ncbi:MAG: spore coat protein CotJB [Oscillospiraceae bacterium]|nr:spore coat protein CotJB [Oscillospiraceae bacterium]
MTPNRTDRDGMEGRLPAMAPLANPYVPFQLENPPKYEARKGLVRGTLFPGLDLPFMGMVNQKELNVTPMTELQALGFAIQELALYLDTHREDREALELYRDYQKMYEKCRQEFRRNHGPLNHGAASESENYDWLDDPWPWEYCKNKEA